MSGSSPGSPHSGNGNGVNGHSSLWMNGGEDPRDEESTELVRRFQGGDRSAFARLYEMWRGDVQAYVFVSVREEGRAEDVVQDVFAKALQGLAKFKVKSKQGFRCWLFRITRNRVIDLKNSASAVPTEPLPEEGPADPDPLEQLDFMEAAPLRPIHRLREELALQGSAAEDEPSSPEQRLAQAMDWIGDKELAQLFGTLPKSQQRALALRFGEDLSAREVAEVMHCSVTKVWQLQSRAMRYLADRLELVGKRRIRARRRDAMLRRIGPLPVLGARRFSLSTRPRLPGSSRSSGMERYSGFAQSARW